MENILKQYLERLENDTKNILISFLRFYGINKNSNKPKTDFKIELWNNKLEFNLITSSKFKENERDCLISYINISDKYIEVYYSKLGNKQSFRIDFESSDITNYSNIEFIEIRNNFKIMIPKENKILRVNKLVFRKL